LRDMPRKGAFAGLEAVTRPCGNGRQELSGSRRKAWTRTIGRLAMEALATGSHTSRSTKRAYDNLRWRPRAECKNEGRQSRTGGPQGLASAAEAVPRLLASCWPV